ncbi:MAG: oligopeptide transporter, OPT family [Bacteroidales bacterium]|nr:oligopeptide transporter, OPT family [Bacteroidales bacterium]
MSESTNKGKKPAYRPLLKPEGKYREATAYSVTIGLVMTIIFSAAAAYLGLKVGQVFEAAIPIAIIAVGLSTALKRKNALGENVIIQSIGACSGGIVAGAIFTLPALYILQAKYPEIQIDFIKVFLSSLLGGILGILFLIPFRKYFVKDKDGEYPFPEATATTQVIKSGEGDTGGAKLLLISGLIGGIYDFIVASFGWWSETIYTTTTHWGSFIADKTKVLVKYNVGAAVLGLGYIIGLKYAFIICCGSMLVWFVIIPLMSVLCGAETVSFLGTTFSGVSEMGPEMIFKTYARQIGIGGIAVAGIIGIIKSSGVIKSAFGLASKSFSKKGDTTKEEIRTQRDLSMKIIVWGLLIALAATFVFFYFGVIPDTNKLLLAIIALLIVTIIAFLFTTVAANAIAIVGSNPVSGMTLMTLILGSVVLVACGLKGVPGMVAALIIGGVVCTALSVAGSFITDLKIGYWIGSTPKVQESWKFIGTLVAAATVGGVMIVLNKTYGFTGEDALVAPQANAMAAVIEPLMSGQGAPWVLYGIGGIIAIILNFLKVPALAFALGMFIPIDLNLPLLAGGAIAWYVGSRSKDKALNEARVNKGTLLASGFIAGGALMGVVSAILKFAGKDFYAGEWAQTGGAQAVAIVAYLLVAAFLLFSSLRAKSIDDSIDE